MSKTHHFDITIIGAGIVGLFSAIVLAKRGFSVALCDASSIKPFAIDDNPLDYRPLAISLSSKHILQAFDCWQNIQAYSQEILDIQVSSQGHWGVTRLNHQQQKCPALGYVVDSHVLHNSLLQQLADIDNITTFEHSHCQALEQNSNGTLVSLLQNEAVLSIQTSLLLIADGSNSQTRELAGFSVEKTAYEQSAIAANITGLLSEANTAYERFTPQGPMAMLPLNNSRYGLVWANSCKRSESLCALNDQDFLKELQQAFGYRLGTFSKVGKRFSFPLFKIISTSLVKNRAIVLGNAAHNLHPVAGQSLNLALRDIAHLFDLIKDTDHLDDDLQQYQSIREKDHQQVIQLGDTLVNIFSNDLPVLNHARSAALALLDINPHLKHSFAWRGMGFAQQSATAVRGHINE